VTALLAADSWLVADGRVRAFERHWARFSAACAAHGIEPEALARLRARVERVAREVLGERAEVLRRAATQCERVART
jgi:hypothetical protein